MTKQVTLDLPDAVYEHMKQVATADNRSFAEILADAIVQIQQLTILAADS
ncbi:MAG TPA: hypothetical protein VL334_12205 [Anaerolineae bacterium]|nr:hypothetical protein [Anaerolineae bacterium]